MLRKSSFVIIQIEDTEMITKNTIKIDISFWESIRFFIYYVFSFVYIFLRQYPISGCYFDKSLEKAPVSKIKILDNGILLDHYNVLIPYEYILYITSFKGYNVLVCFAKADKGTIQLADSLLYIKLYNTNPIQLQTDIRNNMYYHLTYNKKKVDFGVLNFSTFKKIRTR
jgi:hypothetical protein